MLTNIVVELVVSCPCPQLQTQLPIVGEWQVYVLFIERRSLVMHSKRWKRETLSLNVILFRMSYKMMFIVKSSLFLIVFLELGVYG